MPPAEDSPIELEHAIGLSALRGGLHYHANGREYLFAAGASIIARRPRQRRAFDAAVAPRRPARGERSRRRRGRGAAGRSGRFAAARDR